MEISNEYTYIIKINNEFVEVNGKDILLCVSKKNKDVVVMYDKETKEKDIEDSLKLIFKH